MYFDIFKDPQAQRPYYFVAKGNNNEPVFTSEMYASKQGALNAIDMVRREAEGAKVFDETEEARG